MKRYFTLLLFLALGLATRAQSLSVASFKLLENDLTAITHGTEVLDQNGNTCALLKIQTSQTGFAFDVGMMGITKTEQHTGEIWVYVPFGVKHISIHHQHLGHLNDYYFPCSIEKGRTYRMELVSGNVVPVVEQDDGGSYFVMKVKPYSASVYIDGKIQTLKNGTFSQLLPYGTHDYRVEANGYATEVGKVEISKEKKILNVELKSSKATLTVNAADADAQIFVNDDLKGTGSWTGSLNAGFYVVEVRKEGCRTRKESISLGDLENKELHFQALSAVFGRLRVDSDPLECEVYLDDKHLGTTPDIFNDVPAGAHILKLAKDGYVTLTRPVAIEEGKTSAVVETLTQGENTAETLMPAVAPADPSQRTAICFDSKPSKAELIIDGHSEGRTSMTVDLPYGKHHVKAVKHRRRGDFVGEKEILVTADGANFGGYTNYSNVRIDCSEKHLKPFDQYINDGLLFVTMGFNEFHGRDYNQYWIEDSGISVSVGFVKKFGAYASYSLDFEGGFINIVGGPVFHVHGPFCLKAGMGIGTAADRFYDRYVSGFFCSAGVLCVFRGFTFSFDYGSIDFRLHDLSGTIGWAIPVGKKK